MPARRGILRRGFPFFVALVILGFVFWRVPLGEVVATARLSRLELFVPMMVAAVGCWFAIESAAYAYLFSRFNVPVSWREARALRGVTYLLGLLHYHVGKAGVVLQLRRAKGVPLLEGTSSLLLYQLVDGLVLASLATVGLAALALWPAAKAGGTIGIPVWATAGLAAAPLLGLALLRLDWPRMAWLERLRGRTVLRAQRAIETRDLLVLAAFKTLFHAVFVGVFYWGPRAFGVEPPLALVLAATPIILIVGALPITPAGLGTQQAALLFFFMPPDAGGDGSQAAAAILAFGMGFPLVMIATRSLLGLYYLRSVSEAQSDRSPR